MHIHSKWNDINQMHVSDFRIDSVCFLSESFSFFFSNTETVYRSIVKRDAFECVSMYRLDKISARIIFQI